MWLPLQSLSALAILKVSEVSLYKTQCDDLAAHLGCKNRNEEIFRATERPAKVRLAEAWLIGLHGERGAVGHYDQ